MICWARCSALVRDRPVVMMTVLLPRRTYAPLVGRLLHDRTADKMAGAISRIEGATAQLLVEGRSLLQTQ